MDQTIAELDAVGLEVTDLSHDGAFALRRARPRSTMFQMENFHQLATAFVENPESILQELVNAAVRLCGADSAGISIEREDKTDRDYYRWIATAGIYSSFLDASLPKFPSACTVCLHRESAQSFRVDKRFFDILGVQAASVMDGILLPWQVEGMRGTIFIISDTQKEAFDSEDLRLMQVFSYFTAMGIRQQKLHHALVKQAGAAAAVTMAHDLAHQINNPLQSLTNTLFLAKGGSDPGEQALAERLEPNFERLSVLTKHLLELPRRFEASDSTSNG